VNRAAWIVAGAVLSAVSADPPTPLTTDRAAYLSRLHDGRFNAAVETNSSGPDDAERRFFAAFITYWRLVFDDDNPQLQTMFDHQLDGVVSAADADSAQDGGTSPQLWSGNGHLLLGQLRAWEKKPMAAAFEAKKAKKALESAVKGGANASDAYFGLGTYNYMADALPGYVKGLRALLFLPAGDRERGLEQLETAARESRLFAFEARVLLMTIYANRHERLYTRAMEQRDLLLAQAPDTVASLYASARLDISLGRNDSARLASATSTRSSCGRSICSRPERSSVASAPTSPVPPRVPRSRRVPACPLPSEAISRSSSRRPTRWLPGLNGARSRTARPPRRRRSSRRSRARSPIVRCWPCWPAMPCSARATPKTPSRCSIAR
jgi:hypothetical protein